MVVGGLDSSTQEFLRARGVNLVPFQKAYMKPTLARLTSFLKPFLTRKQLTLLDEQLATAYMHFWCARHFFYRAYLDECGGGYDFIMLSDVRDVLFQNNPFAFEIPVGLSVFLEDLSQTIGSCPSNSSWVRRGFGDAILKELADKPISCAGTIFGTLSAVRDHVDHHIRIFCENKQKEVIDQAAHNFIIYKEPQIATRFFSNDDGLVLTMAHVKSEKLKFNNSGLLVNSTNRVYNTIHQYDRHPDLMPQLLKVLT